LGCSVLTDFDLDPRASSFFGGLEKSGSNILIDILFTKLGADTSWNPFEEQET